MAAKKAATVSFSAARMEDFRERKGITRRTLGATLGVTEGTLYNWGNGRTLPDADQVQRLAEALGVDINDLYE